MLVAAAVEAFLAAPGLAGSPNMRREYGDVLHRVADRLGPGRELAGVDGDEVGVALTALWGAAAPSTWNRNRAALSSWLSWCSSKARWSAPGMPGTCERRSEPADETKAVDRPPSSASARGATSRCASGCSTRLRAALRRCSRSTSRTATWTTAAPASPSRAAQPSRPSGAAAPPCCYLRGRTSGPLFCTDRRSRTRPARHHHQPRCLPRHRPDPAGLDRARVLIAQHTGADPANPEPLRRHPPRRRHRHHGQRPPALHPHRRPLHPPGLAAVTTTKLLDPPQRRG